MYRLSYERRGDISFIARGTISYFVTSERSERGTKYDIVTRAIKLILPSLECDNLFITYLCLHQGQKSGYIFTFIYRSGYSYWNSTPSLVCYSYCNGNISCTCWRNIRLFRFL